MKDIKIEEAVICPLFSKILLVEYCEKTCKYYSGRTLKRVQCKYVSCSR